MNLQAYRSSFVVFVSDSNLERGGAVATALSDSGYATEQRLSLESLWKEVVKNPPHIMVFFFEDPIFFPNNNARKDLIEKLQSMLPEVQIIFLCDTGQLSEACKLYELGIYDCLIWPTVHPMQLLRAVDRAAENDYYMYLNEQMKDTSASNHAQPDSDFAMFNVWLKLLESSKSREQAIQLWLREAVRIFHTDEAIYFNYLDSKKSLVATYAVGISSENIQNVGLDLGENEPGFHAGMLHRPEEVRALHDFVIHGLLRDQALYFTLLYQGEVQGLFVVPAKKGSAFHDHAADSGYMQTCLLLLQRQLNVLDLISKHKKFSVYDDESEALIENYLSRKITEEISRARRIVRPVSLLFISIDQYEDIVLANSNSTLQKFLKSFSEILFKNSRLNDLVGRISRDQFAVCLPHTDRRGAAVKAERIRRIIESADVTNILGAGSKITVSIGISEYPNLCNDTEGLLRSAEVTMLEIRKVGGNKIGMANQPSRFVPDFVVKDSKDAATHGS